MPADASMDYERFPTFAPLPEGMETDNAFICCDKCRGNTFRLRKRDYILLCTDCGQEMIELSDFQMADAPHLYASDSVSDNYANLPQEPDSLDEYFRENCPDLSEEAVLNLKNLAKIIDFDPANDDPEISTPENFVSAAYSAPWFQILRTRDRSVVLRPDGTVRAIGSNKYGQCKVDAWKDICAIATASTFTAGLDTDGKVRYAGQYWIGKLVITGWSNVTAIAAGNNFLAALFENGSVKAVGGISVPALTGITAIAASDSHLVVRSMDGSVRVFGLFNPHGMCNVQSWSGIRAVAIGTAHTVGLCEDGTVKAVGFSKKGKYEKNNRCEVQDWADITAIAAGSMHTVGLRSDGRVYAVGNNEKGQCDVWDWRNVIAICAGDTYTAALCVDGTILCTDPALKKLAEEACNHI